jgi:hypothetical protein
MAGIAGGTNPIAVIDDNPMSVRQWIVVVLMVLLNALDGFDVLSERLRRAGITKEWGIDARELGIVLSAELVGMGFGSVILGGVADKLGASGDARLPRDHGDRHVPGHPRTGGHLTIWRFITGSASAGCSRRPTR